ncbi:MAG TPA: ribosome small subunit-dependent GTPase A [Trebonia sp.]|nr:ribosome small subunit-dependent GTPase A [Trebonia sp.]
MGRDGRGAGQLRNRSAYLDEDDVRVRAGKGSRPRTRHRPAHEGATEAFVVNVDRGRYGCLTGISGIPPASADGRIVTAMKARELGRNSVVVGDRVALAGDTSGSAGSLARIVRVAERTSVLRRSPDDSDPAERIVVANAQQMVIVCALADPEPKTRFIDRCLVAAYDAGLDVLIAATKSDLASPRKIRDFYRPLGVPIISTRQPVPAVTLSRLRTALAGRVSVMIGQSGVGKSTLVNTLIPDAARAVGQVNAVTGKGRHTSSSAVALELPEWHGSAGWLIDTPGVRGFGLGHVTPDRIAEAFGDLAAGIEGCPPGCDHLSERCGLDAWAAAHHAQARLDSLRRLLLAITQ